MKKVFLALAITCGAATAHAQWGGDITVVNKTKCAIDYELFAADPNAWCSQQAATTIMTIPGLSTQCYNLGPGVCAAPAWLSPAPPPAWEWAGSRVGYAKCQYWASVGDACSFPATSATISSCGGCPTFVADWNPATGQLLFH